MTRVTTITEYEVSDMKIVNVTTDYGMSGRLVYVDDEAKIYMTDCDGELDERMVHPDDAMAEFLSEFVRF